MADSWPEPDEADARARELADEVAGWFTDILITAAAGAIRRRNEANMGLDTGEHAWDLDYWGPDATAAVGAVLRALGGTECAWDPYVLAALADDIEGNHHG